MIAIELTPGQLRVLSAYARTGSRGAAARLLGVSVHTVRQQLLLSYARLGVSTAIDAYRVLGWLRVPEVC